MMFTLQEERKYAHAFQEVQEACIPGSYDEVRALLADLMTLTATYREMAVKAADACAAATGTEFNAADFRADLDGHAAYYLDPLFTALHRARLNDTETPYHPATEHRFGAADYGVSERRTAA